MKLQRAKTREHKGKAYFKFTMNPPPDVIEALGWIEGDDLVAVAKDGALVVRKAETDKSR